MLRTYRALACAIACALICSRVPAQSSAPAASASPTAAEYAIRWNIQDDGPNSAKDTLAALNQQPEESDDFEVLYFDIKAPSDAPAGFTSILRQRRKGQKKPELTFKYRGDRALSAWTCPLPKPDETKEEVDVSILAAGKTKRAYSYSCTLKSKNDPVQPPPALQARPKTCTSKMSRLKAGKLKVEEWHLPGNVVMVEVSRNGSDTPADLESFQDEVVDPLVNAGIKPSDRSKTELGSGCQKSPGGS